MATRINPPPIDPSENWDPFADMSDDEKAHSARWLEAMQPRAQNGLAAVQESIRKHGGVDYGYGGITAEDHDHLADAYAYAFAMGNPPKKPRRLTPRYVTIITYTAATLCLLYLLFCVAGWLFNRECTGASCAASIPISNGITPSSTGDDKYKRPFPFGDSAKIAIVSPVWEELSLRNLNGSLYTCRSLGDYEFCSEIILEPTGHKN